MSRRLLPYLATLDAAFLLACGTTAPADGGTDGTTGDAILSPDIGFGGCVEAGTPISYELCTDATAPDACASSCMLACDRDFGMVNSCTDDSTDGGTAFATCVRTLCAGGRRPVGLRKQRPSRGGLRAWLSGTAWMEAASVHAFERLARELEAHGAPRWLVREAERAARDERRHARVMKRLARDRGARVSEPRLPARRVRPLAAIARENAVEGCVHETFGALAAAVQSREATDPEIRHAMSRIARDEKRHAALAHAVADWVTPRLSSAQRTRIEGARTRAASELTSSLLRAPSIPVAGLVGGHRAAAMSRALEAAVLHP